MEEEAFPCPLEINVASALLLLSTTPPNTWRRNNDSDSLMLCSSRSIASSNVSSEYGSSTEVRDCQFQMISAVSGSRELKLEVTRKTRSKTFRISDCRDPASGKSKAVSWGSAPETIEASSCLSSSSSSTSCARSCKATPKIRKREALAPISKRKQAGSILMRRRAEAILGLLSDGCTSEVRIRQLLGYSPDTSKALRMLLKKEEVKRAGAGGRHDPYIYTKS